MIKIEVTGNSITEVADKLLALGNSLRQTTAAPVEVAAKRAKKIEAAVAPDPVDEIVFEPSVVVGPAPVEEPVADPAIKADTLKDLVLTAVRAKGRDTVVALLETFGVAKATDVPAAQYDELVTALSDLLK